MDVFNFDRRARATYLGIVIITFDSPLTANAPVDDHHRRVIERAPPRTIDLVIAV